MKGIFSLFFFIGTSSAFVIYGEPLLGNSLDKLITEALEYIRTLLKKHDPYTLPSLPDQHIVDKDVDFVIGTSGVQISNAADFIINKISNNLPQLKASFGITFPNAHIKGNYKISGKAYQKSVQGSGSFDAEVTKFVQTGDIQFDVVDHSLQISNLNLDYSLESLKTHVDGLAIEGYTPEQVQDLFNKQIFIYLNNDKIKPLVTKKVSNHVKEIANTLMKGKSLKEIIDWLKQLVSSTPDPPPFTFSN